jgi:hypothetical protein
MKNKLIKLLNLIFAPRVINYYNDKKVSEMPKEFKDLNERFNKLNKAMDDFWK